jgi:hypothetical protein
MPELDREQESAEEFMEDRQVLRDRLVEAHPVQHGS